MILRIASNNALPRAFPRVCGGDPNPPVIGRVGEVLFPACAGVILGMTDADILDGAFPRVCGGDPIHEAVFPSLIPFPRVCGGDPPLRVVPAMRRNFSPRVRG